MTEITSSLPPLSERPGALGWMRRNLFSTWGNSLLTLLSAAFLVWAIRGLLIWIFSAAEWGVILVNMRLIMVGQYPVALVWRIWVAMYFLAFLIGNTVGLRMEKTTRKGLAVGLLFSPLVFALFSFSLSARLAIAGLSLIALAGWRLGSRWPQAFRRLVLLGWIIYFPIFMLLVRGVSGEGSPMEIVGSNLWGGLLLTFMLTVVGIVFSFPLGVFLALGRRSQLPVVRWFSVGYIELVRGVPLITILFMAQLMLPLFLPTGVTIDRVIRAMVGITLFSAAYLAENVRGGLQAIPKGQFEAAHALGLSGFQSMFYIILPQALRLVIPILVGQFIALFKDTSLVAIVGLFDLLGIAKTVLAQPDFLGLQREVYAFISLIYWVLSYAMSYFSQRLEVALGVGER